MRSPAANARAPRSVWMATSSPNWSKAKPLPRSLVKRLHLVIGLGEDHARCVRRGRAVAVPALDQIGARMVALFGNMDKAVLLTGADRLARPLGCELACRHTLPVLTLTANVGDLDATMTRRNRPECRPRFDRLELFGVTNQHDLGAALLGFGNDALHRPRTNHPGFVDDEHIAQREKFAVLLPLMFEAGGRARRDPRSAFQILGSDTGQRRTTNGIAGTLPDVPRNAEHRRLAGTGIADHDTDPLSFRQMVKGIALFARQHHPARFGADQRARAMLLADAVAPGRVEPDRRGLQPLFGLDHIAADEAFVTAAILAERDVIRTGVNR